ncbi:MAG: S8 family peptidase, partial [Deltaproteobacteria bacterium]|nr:S8 family peptidase [Deltaproteobacteria bacterium]
MSSNRLIFGSIVILSDDAPLLRREPDQPEKDAPKPSGITTVPAGIAAIPASTNRSLNLDEALAFLAEKFREVAAEIKALPAESFPDDFAVVELILQPGRLNADNYPRHFFQGLNLTVLSSRYVKRRLRHLQGQSPEQPERPESSRDCLALHLAGRKSDLAEAARKIAHLEPKAFSQMAFLEGVLLPSPEQKVKACGVSAADCFETVLSLLPGRDDSFPCSQFRQYAESLGFQVLDHHREIVKNTAFIPVRGPRAALVKLAEFAFVRQILDVPKMRPFRPFNPLRSLQPESASAARPDESEPEVPPAQTSPEKPPAAGAATAPFSLPPLPENLPDLGVAILDGGLPPEHPLDKALKAYVKVNPEADDDPGSPEHGLAVTSAFLCGSLPRQGQAQCPYSKVTAVRVLDAESADDAVDTFYKTLRNVKKTLETGKYKFVNLSLGPDVVVQDEHIHVWTSVIDEQAYRKGLFVTVAAGNNGLSRLDGVSPERMLSARIQVPSDAVNVLSVGALDRQSDDWRRSYFSAIGPGRKPTVMKPDLVSFGGGDDEPFLVLAPSGEIQ